MAAPIIYADSIVPDFGLPFNDEMIEALKVAPEDKLIELKKNQEFDPVMMGWRLPNWDAVLEGWQKYRCHVVLGGNRCISGDTIVFDPVAGNYLPITERIGRKSHVLTWNGEALVAAEVGGVLCKAPMPMVRVQLTESAGTSGINRFTCATSHQVLTAVGYLPIESIKVGDKLVSPWSMDGSGFQQVLSIEDAGTQDVYDLTVHGTENYWCGGAIHHNSSKSALMARLTLHLAMTIPGFRGRCWSMNEESSVNDQQRVVWENLPQGYKNLPKKRAIDHSISYTQKNGFTGGKLILPSQTPGYPGSEIIFQTYRSWMNDPQVAEGWWAHWIWGDEEMPAPLFQTLLFRLVDAHGRFGLSFTTLNGWTPLVQELLNGAKTLKKRRSELVGRDLPVMQESKVARTVIHYFWTSDNLFIDHEEFTRDLMNRSEPEKLARAHGVPTKSRTNVFSAFSRDVHVVPHDQIPFIKDPKYLVTRYHGIDPAGRKPWVILWGAYDAAGVLWIYREFPDVPTYGDWAIAGGDTGAKAGPAQMKNDFGYKDYKQLLYDGKEQSASDIAMSAVDPRYSASETQGDEGAETMLSKMLDHGVYLVPSPGSHVADGEGILNDMLQYDQKRPVGSDNRPMLMISDRCENLIASFENYTGRGQDEPWKDQIDAARYLVQTANGYMDPRAKVVTGGGSY